MRCDEIKEKILDFVYDEENGPEANAEVMEHLRTCAACRRELEELKQTRKFLQLWKEDAPSRNAAVAMHTPARHRSSAWRYMRYGAIAAMFLICAVALANLQIRWNKSGFSFSASLLGSHNADRDTYTKEEIRNLIMKALDDSEIRINETNFVMMKKLLETIEQDQWVNARLTHKSLAQNQNKN